MTESLPIPDAAKRDARATNMASVWVAEGGLHCSLQVGIYQGDPNIQETRAWGIILADLARHVANALIADGMEQGPHEDVVNRIWTAFHEEMSTPTSPVSGKFADKPKN